LFDNTFLKIYKEYREDVSLKRKRAKRERRKMTMADKGAAKMAREEIVAMLRHSVWEFNEWRRKNGNYLDLSMADLRGLNLEGVDFSYADLGRASFDRANLSGANFTGAYLRGAIFDYADLSGANFTGANLELASLKDADISDAIFSGANLRGADLTFVLFSSETVFLEALLSKAYINKDLFEKVVNDFKQSIEPSFGQDDGGDDDEEEDIKD